jgi:hypothetical protein
MKKAKNYFNYLALFALQLAAAGCSLHSSFTGNAMNLADNDGGGNGSTGGNPSGNPTPGPSGTATPSPTPTPTCGIINVSRPLRILIMVDDSGSTNTNGTPGSQGYYVGTDPDDFYRTKTVNTFLTNYGSKTNLTYSFGYFDKSSYIYNFASGSFNLNPAMSGNATNQVFGASTDESTALTAFDNLAKDYGGTSYHPPISALQQVITNDMATSTGAGYVVVFMSDGMNYDGGSSYNASITAAQNQAATQGWVTSLIQAATPAGQATSSATFNTVYFGPPASTAQTNADAIANLKGMATAGGGVFVDTNTTTQLSIDNLLTIPVTSCN